MSKFTEDELSFQLVTAMFMRLDLDLAIETELINSHNMIYDKAYGSGFNRGSDVERENQKVEREIKDEADRIAKAATVPATYESEEARLKAEAPADNGYQDSLNEDAGLAPGVKFLPEMYLGFHIGLNLAGASLPAKYAYHASDPSDGTVVAHGKDRDDCMRAVDEYLEYQEDKPIGTFNLKSVGGHENG